VTSPSVDNPFNLTARQLQAAQLSNRGPVVVGAGAGTGKTKTLVARYIALLDAGRAAGTTDAGVVNAILAITYTDAAALEMKQRIEETLRDRGDHELARRIPCAWISTIHSFCKRILRKYALEADLDPHFRVLDAADEIKERTDELLLDAIIANRATGEYVPNHSLRADYVSLLQHMPERTVRPAIRGLAEGLRGRGVDLSGTDGRQAPPMIDGYAEMPSGVGQQAGETLLRLASEWSHIYARQKEAQSGLDFDDLLLYCRRLMQSDVVAQRVREQFTAVMVDEFQDTNRVHLDIIERFEAHKLFFVGDHKQSIYRFQGAEAELFVAREARAQREGLHIELDRNFRSDTGVLAFCNRFFATADVLDSPAPVLLDSKGNATDDIADDRIAQRVHLLSLDAGGSGRKGANNAEKQAAEAEWIAEVIEDLRTTGKDGGYTLNDMVLLVETRSQGDGLAAGLREQGIESFFVKGEGFYTQPVVRAVADFVRCLRNPDDDVPFLRLLLGAFGRLTDAGLVALGQARRAYRDEVHSLWQTARDPRLQIPAADGAELAGLVDCIERGRLRLGVTSLSEILESAAGERGLDRVWPATGTLEQRQAAANLCKLYRMADDWQNSGGEVLGFADYLERQRRLKDKEPQAAIEVGGGVLRMMTIHNSKGDEFPVVIVPLASSDKDKGADSGRHWMLGERAEDGAPLLALRFGNSGDPASDSWAAIAKAETARNCEEKRRLLYVALTRAAEHLLVSYQGDGAAKGGLSRALTDGIAAAGLEGLVQVRPVGKAKDD
jgi:ATP-dependent exoDNAse (exonuclease V) beta subunit